MTNRSKITIAHQTRLLSLTSTKVTTFLVLSVLLPSIPSACPPTALQIIRDENLEGKLVGKVIVIKGATSGIGLETARALSATDATLLLTARDLKKAETALSGILETSRVTLVEMDNESLTSVRTAAASILEKSNNQVNILIANAGIMGVKDLTLTEDGHEMHFAINHLSHFLQFQLLKPALLASSTPGFHSRVVAVSSTVHRMSKLNENDNYNFQKGGYNFGAAYANSKLANIYMANELDRRYGQLGLHATSLHPSGVNTNMRYVGQEFVDRLFSNENFVKLMKSPEQGAATTVFAAVRKEWEDKGGKYLMDCEEARLGEDDGVGFGYGWVKHTYDPSEEDRLWKDSLTIVGIKDDK